MLRYMKPTGVVLSPALLATTAAGLFLIYHLGHCIYQLFFNPLRKFPGPKLWTISYIPYARLFVSGSGHREILDLHRRYGPIVRVGPDHLSINHPDGMQAVRGHRKGAGENPKDRTNARANLDNIIGANRAEHQRFRRALSHVFSAQAVLGYQPVIKQYVDLLFEKLHAVSKGGAMPVNVEKWFNFATFDMIGDLTFGERFGCLEAEAYHPWAEVVFPSIKNMAFLTTSRRLPWIGPLLMMLLPSDLANKFDRNLEFSEEQMHKRLALGAARPDFTEAMVKRSEAAGKAMSFGELLSNAFVLISAGSETTATLLSAATFYLGTHPAALAKLSGELRSAFQAEDQIDVLSVQSLPYLMAVLSESMRLFPPAPGSSPREIGAGGDTILGEYIPEATVIDVWQWSVYHNPDHFAQPEDFIPERWLGDPRFANDARQALQPFSTGPRNCIGKNLAYAEMRLILARLVWNFDIRVAEDTVNWVSEGKTYILWQRGPMSVYLAPRT